MKTKMRSENGKDREKDIFSNTQEYGARRSVQFRLLFNSAIIFLPSYSYVITNSLFFLL